MDSRAGALAAGVCVDGQLVGVDRARLEGLDWCGEVLAAEAGLEVDTGELALVGGEEAGERYAGADGGRSGLRSGGGEAGECEESLGGISWAISGAGESRGLTEYCIFMIMSGKAVDSGRMCCVVCCLMFLSCLAAFAFAAVRSTSESRSLSL